VLTLRNPAANTSNASTDRRTVGSSPSTLPVYEGSILSVAGVGASLTSSANSVLDLGSTYISGGVRYDQLSINGPLTLNGGTLNFNFNPLQFRPSEFGPLGAGTLVLVTATGGFSGTFDTITGIGSDHIGFSMMSGSPMVTSTVNPLTDLDPNTWLLEYNSTTNSILFHYNLTANVPEPGTLGLILLGAAFLRRFRLRA